MHPLHHPSAYAGTRVWVKGEGARITDATGREYLDGLSGLWNVNIGHGRRELADAAQKQMCTLAFHSAYAGGTNEQAIRLAERLSGLAYPSINTFFFTSGGAESSESVTDATRAQHERPEPPTGRPHPPVQRRSPPPLAGGGHCSGLSTSSAGVGREAERPECQTNGSLPADARARSMR